MFERLTFGVRHLGRGMWPAERRAAALRGRAGASAGERAARPDHLLRRSVLAACEVPPAYARLKGRVPAREIADCLRDTVPVRGKDALRARRAELYPRAGRPRWWWLVGKTSGSTPTPLDLFRSLDSALWEQAFHREVRLVPTNGFDDADARHLLRNFPTLVSSRLNLRVTCVDDIALLPGGKVKSVAREGRPR